MSLWCGVELEFGSGYAYSGLEFGLSRIFICLQQLRTCHTNSYIIQIFFDRYTFNIFMNNPHPTVNFGRKRNLNLMKFKYLLTTFKKFPFSN